jgi:hypothetical protein
VRLGIEQRIGRRELRSRFGVGIAGGGLQGPLGVIDGHREVAGDLVLRVGRAAVDRRRLEVAIDEVAGDQRGQLRLDVGHERGAEQRNRADAGDQQPEREDTDRDAGDLRAQADAPPPGGDRIRLVRHAVLPCAAWN